MKDSWGKEDYIHCCTVKVKLGTRNLKIGGSVTEMERRWHAVSRGKGKIFICHCNEWKHKNTEKKLE
jgi:hypothetical protein